MSFEPAIKGGLTQPRIRPRDIEAHAPDVREVAVSSLESLGYRMLAAENGPAALRLLARNGPVDLLVVDMAMPGMNGVELIRRVREQHPGLKAMLVTGYADVAAFAPAENDLVLQKPYRLERLAETVAEALRREVSQQGSNVVAIRPVPRRVRIPLEPVHRFTGQRGGRRSGRSSCRSATARYPRASGAPTRTESR